MIPSVGHFDHFGLTAPLPLTEDVFLVCSRLSTILGFDLEVSRWGWGQIFEFLGLVAVGPPFPASRPLLFPPDLEKGKLKGEIAEIPHLGRVPPAAPRRLSCKAAFLLDLHYGRNRPGHAPPVGFVVGLRRLVEKALPLGQNGSCMVVQGVFHSVSFIAGLILYSHLSCTQ